VGPAYLDTRGIAQTSLIQDGPFLTVSPSCAVVRLNDSGDSRCDTLVTHKQGGFMKTCLLLGHIFNSVSCVVSFVTFSFPTQFPLQLNFRPSASTHKSSTSLSFSYRCGDQAFQISMTISKFKYDILTLYSTFMGVFSVIIALYYMSHYLNTIVIALCDKCEHRPFPVSAPWDLRLELEILRKGYDPMVRLRKHTCISFTFSSLAYTPSFVASPASRSSTGRAVAL